MKTYIIVEDQDYSISLTVNSERVIGVSMQCSYKTSASAKASQMSMTCILSDFGTTEIEIPQSVQDKRNPSATAEQSAIIDDKKYSA